MSSTSQPAVATPKAWPEVRSLAGSDLVEVLAAGVNDLRAGGRYSLFFGAFYGVGGLILLVLVRFYNVPYLIYPLAMGFVLIAPFMATGLYDISRRLENGETLSWAGVLGSIRYAAGRDLRWMALITSFTFVIWMDIAALMTFGFLSGEMTGFKDLLTQIFTTPSGLLFLAVGNIVGALIALVVFSFSAVSFPMLYDRDVDFVTAMVSSIRLVLKNPVVMLSWGAIIGVLTVISILSAFLGLIVTLPVLGHATWHLYRRGVAPSGEISAAARGASHPIG